MGDRPDDLPEPLQQLTEIVRRMQETGEVPKSAPNPPERCPRCAQEMQRVGDLHCSYYKECQRRTGWIEWAECPACQLWFVRHSPPRTPGESGWQVDPDPPEFGRDTNWFAALKRASQSGEA